MKAFITGIFVMLVSISELRAQPGRNALGIRETIDGTGATWKHFLDRSFAVETQFNVGGIQLLEGSSVSAACLIEYHLPLPSPEFRIFFGGGFHFGTWWNREQAGHPNEGIFGLDGIGGIEYIFRKMPIGMSADLKPSLNYVQEVEFFPHSMIGFSVRYYFGSNRVKPVIIPGQKKRRG